MLLLKKINLYTPNSIGIVDILINNGKIEKISKDINANCETLDCQEKIACPMFVDGHEHLINDAFYTPNGIINSGVGTVVGVLADEPEIKFMDLLVAKTNELRERTNLNAYCLAGSKNCLYDFAKYIENWDFVVGLKTALFSNQRPKPNLSYEKLRDDSLKTYNAGKKANKKVQVHIHLDHPFKRGESVSIEEINLGRIDNLSWIDKIVQETGVPYSLFKLTHAQKYYNRILEYANKGVYIDYTAFSGDYDKRFDPLVNAIKTGAVDVTKVSISSDLGIQNMERGLIEKETPITILNTVKKLVLEKGLNFDTVLRLVTTNAFAPIKEDKYLIYEGGNCKMLILGKNLEIDRIL